MRAFRYLPANADLRYHNLSGRGPVLAWIHGLGASGAQSFVEVARSSELANRRSLVPDLLGFGLSDRPAGFSYSMDEHADSIVRLLGEQNLGDVALVGHSMGGAIALLVAARRRRGLCASSSPNRIWIRPRRRSRGTQRDSRKRSTRGSGHAELVGRAAADPSVPGGYVGSLRIADPIAVHRSACSLIAPRFPTFREVLYALRIPQTFLFGERNAADPDVRELPLHGVQVRIIRGAGHDMIADNACAFVAAVADALK